MVTRNAADEKQEHALSFTFKSAAHPLNLSETVTARQFHCKSGGCILPESRGTSGGAAGMIDTVVKPRTKVKTKTERPKLHKVILVNDDYTPREFVVTVLKAEFRMSEDQAHKVMITAHRRGVCVVAVFTKDVAETKATRATDAGRAKGYPLLFTTEPEE
jgi:ATP-dependent Clp protease adaptor protein ClpS